MVQRILITTVWCWAFISKHAEAEECANRKYGIQDFDTDVAQSIIDRLDTKLNQRASFLTNLSHIIRSECVTYTTAAETESLTSFDNLTNMEFEYSEVYAAEISLTASTCKLPDGVDTKNDHKNNQRDARISQLLASTMRSLYDDHCVDSTDETDEYCNLYFGTINGLFRQYPGVENTIQSGSHVHYDPRFREWYVRLSMAKQAVVSVLNTLGSSSFVNVAALSDELRLPCIVSATHRNEANLMDFVENIQAIAFNTAFDIFQSTQEDVFVLIEEPNTVDISAVVFSFTLGDETTANVPEKAATITDGIYTNLIKVPPGNVTYHAGVGPSSLSIVIYSESTVAPLDVPCFGLKGSPSMVWDGNMDCVTNSSGMASPNEMLLQLFYVFSVMIFLCVLYWVILENILPQAVWNPHLEHDDDADTQRRDDMPHLYWPE